MEGMGRLQFSYIYWTDSSNTGGWTRWYTKLCFISFWYSKHYGLFFNLKYAILLFYKVSLHIPT